MRVVKPKSLLGQHFLKDLKVAQDIADTVDVCPEIPILEVGPGMGVLTQFLLPKETQRQSSRTGLRVSGLPTGSLSATGRQHH